MTPYRIKDSVIDFSNASQIIVTESRYTLIPKVVCGLVIVAGLYAAIYLAALGYEAFQHGSGSFLSRAFVMVVILFAFLMSLAVIAASAGIIANMESVEDTKWVLWPFGLCIAGLFAFGALIAWSIVKMTSGQGPVPAATLQESQQGLFAVVVMILLCIFAALSMTLLRRKTIRIALGTAWQSIPLVSAHDAEKMLTAYMNYKAAA